MGRPRKVTAAPAVEAAAEVDLGSLVEKYIQLRDKKKIIQDGVKEKLAKIDSVLEKIEGLLLATFTEMGVESIKSPAGTAYTSRRSSATVADWDASFGWIRETENWSMLERRVNKSAVEAYKTETGELPPGVAWNEEITVNVRRT